MVTSQRVPATKKKKEKQLKDLATPEHAPGYPHPLSPLSPIILITPITTFFNHFPLLLLLWVLQGVRGSGLTPPRLLTFYVNRIWLVTGIKSKREREVL